MRVSSSLIGLGLVLLIFGGLWQYGLVPASRTTVPAPIALQSAASSLAIATPEPRPTELPLPTLSLAAPTPPPRATPPPVVAPAPTPQNGPPLPLPVPADRDDRAEYVKLPSPGYAVRLEIPAIQLDSAVKQGGIVTDRRGNLAWQTLPFVAVHYGDVTALVGAFGNAVIAGHVVTLSEGNVFRNLYRVRFGDAIEVWDDQDREHTFHVVDIRLVPPDDTSPMAQTPDPTLTLITCGGTFDPIKREFSERLIVVAKPG